MEELIEEQSKKLLEISGLDIEEARRIILQRVEDEMANEIALLIKDAEERAKTEVSRKAQSLLANAIQQYAADRIGKTISVVPLPNDEMKGRIIGREGRNIRAIEANTGSTSSSTIPRGSRPPVSIRSERNCPTDIGSVDYGRTDSAVAHRGTGCESKEGNGY